MWKTGNEKKNIASCYFKPIKLCNAEKSYFLPGLRRYRKRSKLYHNKYFKKFFFESHVISCFKIRMF